MTKIGILNIMHDKMDTKQRLDRIFKTIDPAIQLFYYYPVDHYYGQQVPNSVRTIANPLDLEDVAQLDGFIVTGAPIERKDFTEINYIDELHRLIELLADKNISQLYMCWGAMAAMNHFYGIKKYELPAKLFGIYHQEIDNPSSLLDGLTDGFLAPHARYSEMNHEQVFNNKELETIATTDNGMLFLNTNLKLNQTFLFAHLEYDGNALEKEYRREVSAHPENKFNIQQPQNYFPTTDLTFNWQSTRMQFFSNWLQVVKSNNQIAEEA